MPVRLDLLNIQHLAILFALPILKPDVGEGVGVFTVMAGGVGALWGRLRLVPVYKLIKYIELYIISIVLEAI